MKWIGQGLGAGRKAEERRRMDFLLLLKDQEKVKRRGAGLENVTFSGIRLLNLALTPGYEV